ncbi:hypothetical protein [Loktanella sp. R86503]|uniref:hypothetical protein n=1 Tax=Loktanella sp. R86503 TaxID=3093847 RepID=UPI0036DEA545
MMTARCFGGVMLLCLAGCGGGGGGDAMTPAQIDGQIGGQDVSDPALLPTAGRASYDGYMRAALPTGEDGARVQYLADLTLAVNFGAGFDQIRGQASGFEAQDGVPLAGRLAITDGAIYRGTDSSAAYSFDADLDGTLSGGGESYTIDASLDGEFVGQTQTAVRGLVFGDMTGPAGLDIFDGTFAATRVPQ